MIRLDIISDVACPWCYIGKELLDRALAAEPEQPFHVEWHPYQLNPDMPKEGMDRADYVRIKFGGADDILRIHRPMIRIAEEHGIPLDLAAVTRTPNSADAHRLAHWAGIEGRQHAVVGALFRAYWVEGRDIGDPETLADIAAAHGMDRDVTARLLAGDADTAMIRDRVEHARSRGVDSVPAFVIAGQHVVFGAQPPEVWTRIVTELRAATSGAEETDQNRGPHVH